jgi:phage shock protein A
LKQLRDGFTAALANEKLLEKQLKTNEEQLALWQKRAEVAVQNNNDDVAKQCLQKKNEAAQHQQELTAQLAQQKANTADLKQKYAEMEEQARQFQAKKSSMLSRAKSSDAVANAQELISNTAGKGTDKWEEKIRMKEAIGEATSQLANEDKLKGQFTDSSLEDELAALKQQQQAPAPTPKLIEDKSDDDKK